MERIISKGSKSTHKKSKQHQTFLIEKLNKVEDENKKLGD